MSTPRMTAQQAANELLDTANTIRDVMGVDVDELPREWCHELDTHVMCCETCSWWVDANTIDDDGNCQDCTEY